MFTFVSRRIYDRDMEVVMVSDVEENSGLHKISTMIVHENYKADNQNELNNVGRWLIHTSFLNEFYL